jgi:hypothetical protein
LTCTHRGDATLEYQCVTAAPNAATCPLTITEGANVPTMPADGGRFTLGPLSIAGSTYEGKRDLSIEFGIDLVPESSDSDLWDTLVSIRVVATKITFVGVDLEWLKSTRIPITGKAAAHADTSFYLRKRATGNASAFVDNGTAQHIKFTANGLAVVPNAFDASGNEGATCNLELTTTHDGTNDPLKLTLDTDIS